MRRGRGRRRVRGLGHEKGTTRGQTLGGAWDPCMEGTADAFSSAPCTFNFAKCNSPHFCVVTDILWNAGIKVSSSWRSWWVGVVALPFNFWVESTATVRVVTLCSGSELCCFPLAPSIFHPTLRGARRAPSSVTRHGPGVGRAVVRGYAPSVIIRVLQPLFLLVFEDGAAMMLFQSSDLCSISVSRYCVDSVSRSNRSEYTRSEHLTRLGWSLSVSRTERRYHLASSNRTSVWWTGTPYSSQTSHRVQTPP
jgi:hypothetical protein